ncbi:MAG: cation:proton antiporter [Candidatus Makaraimicrobium thalassicum]|nr:MAG: cation:proton antiporter [Candidatus Omnitrophota bacterium]
MTLPVILGTLVIICLIRAIMGPTVPDRVVAADTANTLVVAMLVVLGAVFRQIIYIDVAIVYAGLAFVSTLCVSKYLEEHV